MMDQTTIDNIIRVNKDFYDKIGPDFDKTRQSAWKGWGRVKEIIGEEFKNRPFSVLDVACGNGRFIGAALEKEGLPLFQYLGVDSNDFLLSKAKILENDRVKFMKLDVINHLEKLSPETFDVVVAFGITHHIPSNELRKKWFSQLSKLVSKNGLLIFTIWNYQMDERFEPSEDFTQGHKLEEGDYFIGWADNKNAKRYFHRYSEAELEEIDLILNSAGLKQTSKFKSDGKNGEMNEYFVYKSSCEVIDLSLEKKI